MTPPGLKLPQDGARVTWVQQEDAQGCGLAVLAMLTRQTYGAVKAEIMADEWAACSGYDWSQHGLTTLHLERYLVRRGFYSQRRYQTWFAGEPWPPEPFANVHYANVVQPSRHGHFVVMDAEGGVHDPLREGVFRLSDWPDIGYVTGLRPARSAA